MGGNPEAYQARRLNSAATFKLFRGKSALSKSDSN